MSEKNCAWCGDGGSGICPECADALKKQKACWAACRRIIDAFETWNRDLPREAVNPAQTIADVDEIRERYTELKRKMGSVADAARIAQVEFMIRVMKEAD
jgi:hypothetical protein